jgi:hypothetical protein
MTPMRRGKIVLGTATATLVGLALWLVINGGFTSGPPPRGPSRDNFSRLHTGMTLAEVEAVLGPAGPSLSSIKSLDAPHENYYIWMGRDGWSRVWTVNGQVTRLEFDPTLTLDE